MSAPSIQLGSKWFRRMVRDPAHLGFQPGDRRVHRGRVLSRPKTRLRARTRATRSAWRRRHSFPGPPAPSAHRATAAPQWSSCAERKNASAISIDVRRGAFASFGRALRRPSGLAPFIDRHFKTSSYGSIYRSRMSQLSVAHPTMKSRLYFRATLPDAASHEWSEHNAADRRA